MPDRSSSATPLRVSRLPAYGVHDGATLRVASEELAQMFGASSAAELVGTEVFALVAVEARDNTMAPLFSGDHTPYRSVGIRVDGATFPMMVACTRIRLGADEGRLFTVCDLSPVAMVVDDEPPIARMTSALLRRLGYQTYTYTEPRQALAEFQSGIVSLVVSDIIMPELDGIALVEQLREHDPELPALFVSGYSNVPAREDERTAMVPKPFSIGSIEAALARLPSRARIGVE